MKTRFVSLSLLGVLAAVGLSAQTKDSGAKQHAVQEYGGNPFNLFMHGDRPAPKSAAEVERIGTATSFYEAGRVLRVRDGQKIEYIPRQHLSNALELAIAEGIVAGKVVVSGNVPATSRLKPGTYYIFFEWFEGHWLARYVGGGITVCGFGGVVAREDVNYGTDASHSAPAVMLHGTGFPGLPEARDQNWAEWVLEWTPFGTGCITKLICVPAT